MKFKRNEPGINQIKAKCQEAFGLTMAILNQEFDDVIESDIAFADLGFVDQDIVDTERFLKSKKFSTIPNGVRWEWAPIAPTNGYVYAAALYAGFMAFGKYPIAGRPWTDRALDRVNVPKWMSYELKQLGVRASFTPI